jgi:hypothetical protein
MRQLGHFPRQLCAFDFGRSHFKMVVVLFQERLVPFQICRSPRASLSALPEPPKKTLGFVLAKLVAHCPVEFEGFAPYRATPALSIFS